MFFLAEQFSKVTRVVLVFIETAMEKLYKKHSHHICGMYFERKTNIIDFEIYLSKKQKTLTLFNSEFFSLQSKKLRFRAILKCSSFPGILGGPIMASEQPFDPLFLKIINSRNLLIFSSLYAD